MSLAARVLLAVAALVFVAGCTPGEHPQASGPAVVLTESVGTSALVAVVPGSADERSLAALVSATARPDEALAILRVGGGTDVLVASNSPAPIKVDVPGRPTGPSAGATAYQRAAYAKRLAAWQSQADAARQQVTTRTQAAMSAWVNSLNLRTAVSGESSGDLANDCAVAASGLTGLQQTASGAFGTRRVVVLYAADLGGGPTSCQLNGDDVIVRTPFLPSVEQAAAAQSILLGAGAASGMILGPEVTPSQVARLVTAGLTGQVMTDSLSDATLFANDGAALLPGAARVLIPLIAPLREHGAEGVINGYASTPGSKAANDELSFARAGAVAHFLEAHGIPAAELIVVGHGATDLIAPGPSGLNRRVTVVIEG